MQLLGDDRAQSIQVGAVLLFGILIVFLALYQATVVPDQNEEIEFDHNEELQEQMTELRSTLVSMPGTANTRSTSLDLGVRYPSRTIFVNPGPASGTLETVGTTDSDHNIRISGAKAVDGEPVGVGDFWDGETERSYNTGSIVYRPGYNQYTNAPRTILEHSAVLNDFDNRGSIPVTGEALYDDGTLTLVAVNGSLSENRVGRAAVDVSPKSTDTQTVELEPEEDEISVDLPIEAGESGWDEVLEELDAKEGITATVEDGVVTLEITDEVEDDFDLELAKVGVGTGATGTDPAYIRDATNEDGTATVTEDDTKELTVEVRDDYNNPKRGVTVNASASEGSVDESKETRRNGEATFEYDSSGVEPGEDDVDFSITEGYEPDETHDSDAPENITITVTVEEESETEPGATDPRYNIAFNEQSIQTQPGVEYNEDADVYTVFAEATLDTDITDANTDEPVAFATADYTLTGGGGASVNPSTNDTTVGGETSTVLKRGGFEDENEVQTRIELAQDELDVRYDGVQINFQPPDADVDDDAFDDVDGFESPYRTPPGFINDTGLEKTEQHNLNFGWDENWAEQELYRPIEGNTRDNIADFEEPLINGTFNHWVDSPAEEYDSTVHPSWSIDLPDGFYEVTIAGGDSDNADQNVSFRVGDNIEDFTDEEFDDETNTRPENGFVKHTGIVEVTDGELVIQPPDGTYNPKLSWLRIVPAERPAESQLDNLDIAGQGIDATIAEGDDEDISVDVENVGEQDGEFDITLEIDDEEEDTEEDVFVAAGETEPVTFPEVTGDLEPGEFDVVVSTDDDDIQGTLTVEDSVGSFSGVVVDEEGDAVEEEVTFEDESGAELGVETPDSGDGSYTVENVPVGTYDVTAIADGFEPDTVEDVEIEEGEETENVDFELIASDEAESELSDLDIAGQGDDATISEGDDEDVSVTVENVGGQEGSFDVTLDIGGEVEETQSTETLDTGEDEIVTFEEVTGDLDEGTYTVAVSTDDDEITGELEVESEPTQPTLNADASNIDPDEVTEGDEDDYMATVELEDLEDVTEGDVTVTLVNYADGTDTDVEETVEESDLSGDTASVEVEFTEIEAPTADNSPYDVDASVDNFDADVDPISQTNIDEITVNAPAESELSNLDIAGQGDDATITEGDDEDVSVDVENIGGKEGEFDVTLEIIPEGETEPVEEETIDNFEVAAGTTENAIFESVTDELDGDDYEVTVSTEDDEISGDLVVIEPTESGLRNAFISDLDDDVESQEQTVEFELTTDIEEGESVDVDLGEAVSGNSRVVYDDFTDQQGPWSVSGDGGNDYTVTFTAGEDIQVGETLSYQIEGVDTTANGADGTYTAIFDRSDRDETIEVEFEVS